MSHNPTDRDRVLSPALRASFGIIVSIATGVIFGLAFHNVAIGIAMALILGASRWAALSVTSAFRRRPDDSDSGAA